MKFSVKNGALFLFVIAAFIYVYVNNLLIVIYIAKPLIVPSLLVYYLSVVKNKKKLFLLGLDFVFLANVVVLFENDDFFFVLSMGCVLLFLLIHMVLITRLIGVFKMSKFLKMALFSMLFFNLITYLVCLNENKMNVLFYIFSVVLGLYFAFSYYFFHVKKDSVSRLNLIGLFFFVVFCFSRILEIESNSKTIWSVLFLFSYPSYLFCITKSLIILDKEESLVELT